MSDGPVDQVRTAEVVSSLCLATDLGMGFPLEHGLHSTLVAMRIADLLGVDDATAVQTYYGCLLFYVGCTADAEITAEMFEEGGLLRYFTPVMFGSSREAVLGIAKALTKPDTPTPLRAVQAASRFPRAARGHRQHINALCEVAQMLSERMGVPTAVRDLFGSMTERWDGKGLPQGIRGDALPLALRIIHVARDATFQSLLWEEDAAADVIRRRGGGASRTPTPRSVSPRVPLLPSSPCATDWCPGENSRWRANPAVPSLRTEPGTPSAGRRR